MDYYLFMLAVAYYMNNFIGVACIAAIVTAPWRHPRRKNPDRPDWSSITLFRMAKMARQIWTDRLRHCWYYSTAVQTPFGYSVIADNFTVMTGVVTKAFTASVNTVIKERVWVWEAERPLGHRQSRRNLSPPDISVMSVWPGIDILTCRLRSACGI